MLTFVKKSPYLPVVARPEALELAERDGLAGVEAALGELLRKSGLQAPEPAGEADAEAKG